MTWHYVPPNFFPEEGGAVSPRDYSDTDPSSTPSGKNFVVQCSNGESERGTSTPRRSGAETSINSTLGDGVERWISYVRDSPARGFLSPGKGSQETTREISGPPRCAPFATYDPHSHFWKTGQLSLLEDTDISGKSSVTWPRTGMMRSGAAWERTRLGRRIDAGERGSCVPTPTVADSRGSRNATATRSGDSTHNDGTTLVDYVLMATGEV